MPAYWLAWVARAEPRVPGARPSCVRRCGASAARTRKSSPTKLSAAAAPKKSRNSSRGSFLLFTSKRSRNSAFLLSHHRHEYHEPQGIFARAFTRLQKLIDRGLALVGQGVNGATSRKHGRRGLNYLEIVVLAAARLGCNLDYDKLQDLVENHRSLRQIMGIGDWQEEVDFDWRRIEDNLIKLRPATLRKINDLWKSAQNGPAPPCKIGAQNGPTVAGSAS